MRGLNKNKTDKIDGICDGGVYTIYGLDKVESLSYSYENLPKESIKSFQDEKKHIEEETWYKIMIQVFIPFFIAGIGTIGAGIIMAQVKSMDVFIEVKALFVLVPALLGLKGNLDMCLASRLSTQANLGKMDSKKNIWNLVIGNILLVQIQSIVASCIVSVFAVSASRLVNGNFQWGHTLLLATASTLTATMSCFMLDLVLVSLIILAHKINLNPDNLATPMAASVGDVVSLIVLSSWASYLYKIDDDCPWLMGLILGIYLLVLLPIWIIIVRRNEYTQTILSHGWTPVITALFISGSGGLVLDVAVDRFQGYAVFQPIINGIGGNLVSVQASRISTMLHKTSVLGVIPPHTKQWVAPWTALFKGVLSAKTARLLILISVPGHLIFVFVADFIYNQTICVTYIFVMTYLTVGLVQLMILLYVCHLLTHAMWKIKMDPDNASIPYLTALGDLSGSTLLLLAFFGLRMMQYEYEPIN